MDMRCYTGNLYSNVSGEFRFSPVQCTVSSNLHGA